MKRKYLLPLCMSFLIFHFVCHADVKSTTGDISFEPNADGQIKMKLNAIGLAVGHESPSANLHVMGNTILNGPVTINETLTLDAVNISSNMTLSSKSIILANTSSDNIVLTLPEALGIQGRLYMIKKTSRNNQLWVSSSELIDGTLNSFELTKPNQGYSYLSLYCNGSEWFIMEKSQDVISVTNSDNLMGWWKLDENSGTVARDSSGRNHHGTLSGGFTFSGNKETGVTSEILGALQFDGVNDLISLGDHADFSFPSNVFTFSCWIKPDDTTSLIGVIGKRGTPWEYSIHTIVAGRLDATAWNTAGVNVYSSVSAYYNTSWTHILYTADGVNAYMFQNGNPVATFSKSIQNMSDTTANLTIGAGGSGTGLRYMKGRIDDVRIYNKFFSNEDVISLFESYK